MLWRGPLDGVSEEGGRFGDGSPTGVVDGVGSTAGGGFRSAADHPLLSLLGAVMGPWSLGCKSYCSKGGRHTEYDHKTSNNALLCFFNLKPH